MKRTVTIALLWAFSLSVAAPAFSQRNKTIHRPVQKIDERYPDIQPDRSELITTQDVKRLARTRFGSAEALTDGKGVLIRWSMATEEKNAGFYVYRIEDTERPVN